MSLVKIILPVVYSGFPSVSLRSNYRTSVKLRAGLTRITVFCGKGSAIRSDLLLYCSQQKMCTTNTPTETIDPIRNSCLFCKISDGKENADIVFQDDNTIVFKDIHPAAKHHYLIVPKHHWRDAKHLDNSHAQMVENLVTLGKQILCEKECDLNDARFGFHWPPFHTISHLHLHAICPVKDMGYIGRIIFRPNSMWFVTPEYVVDRLKKMPATDVTEQ